MVQVEIFNSEYSLNNWLQDHPEHYIRDIKVYYSEHSHTHKFMIIYEDHTKEMQEILEKYRQSPVQIFPDTPNSTSQKLEEEYSIYLNG